MLTSSSECLGVGPRLGRGNRYLLDQHKIKSSTLERFLLAHNSRNKLNFAIHSLYAFLP